MADEENMEINDEGLKELVEGLGNARRRVRQDASHRVVQVASADPERLCPYADQLIEALFRPEAQTRWEVLDVLTLLVPNHADLVQAGCEGAEAALFDETSSAVRLAAFKFLTSYGATSPERSNAVWGLIDEAIQCYHGDPEYRDMLACLVEFAGGALSDKTRDALVARVSFDAEHGRGYIRAFSADILKVAGEAVEAHK